MRPIMTFTRLVLASMIFIHAHAHAHASFQDVGAGARAPGMADVFVGVADNADAVYYNPAGLTQLRAHEVSMQYGQLLRGADDGTSFGTSYLAGAYRLGNGKKGTLGWLIIISKRRTCSMNAH
jgi:long-subunit fatty acid transport protein